MTVPGFDISNWTGTLSPEVARCIADAGHRSAIVRMSLETVMKGAIGLQQIQALHDVGIQTDVYDWCYYDWSPEATVDGSMQRLGELNAIVDWHWLDVEEVSDRVGRAAWEEWIQRALVRVHEWGKKAGIYTGAWYWDDPAYLGGSDKFSRQGVPLWAAYYDGNPDIDVWGRFGGWTWLHGKQYAGSGTARLCGLAVDLNTMHDLILPQAPPDPEPPVAYDSMKIDEVEKWVNHDLQHAQDVHHLRTQRLMRARQGEPWQP